MKHGAANGGYLFSPLKGDAGDTKPVYVHREVATHFIDPAPRPRGCGREVDHIDGDVTNNNVCNLRIVSRSENLLNRKKVSSQYPGVHWNKNNNMWRTMKTYGVSQYFVGYYKKEDDAAQAYIDTTLEWLQSKNRKGYIQKKKKKK
jgi:hypothetical protein